MTKEDILRQPGTDQASKRLDRAVSQLEAILDTVAREDVGTAGKVEALVEENANLRDLNMKVAHRLDAAIDRLALALKSA